MVLQQLRHIGEVEPPLAEDDVDAVDCQYRDGHVEDELLASRRQASQTRQHPSDDADYHVLKQKAD